MNESNSGREEIGDVRERDGNTYIFVKGLKFTKFSNFTMRIDYHGTLEDKSEAYILSCQKQDQSIFTVPLHMSDLDSSAHLYSKIQKFRPSDSQILPEIGRRGKIHSYIDGLIKKYLNQDANEGMFLIERTGFHNIGEHGENMFVVGPEQKIPASLHLSNEILEKEMLWIGPKSARNLKMGPPLSSHEMKSIFAQMKEYHGENMGSFLMLLAYYKVSTHRHHLLQQGGINMPSLHVIGDISTGKSHLGEHFRCLMPYIENSNGTSHLKRDDSPTETVVNEELGMEGPPLLYDPALNMSASAMNKLSDNTFQGVLHRTKHTLGGTLKDARGLVQIHAHENAGLPGLLPTALTKSVLSVHQRQQNPNLEEMDKIHQSFVKRFEEYSGFFHAIVLPIETEILADEKNIYASKMAEDLKGQYDTEILKTSGRAIDNYALMLAGQNQLFKCMDLSQQLCDSFYMELYSFIVKRCLPRTINCLLAADPRIGIASFTCSKEALIKEISDTLAALSPRDFFQTVFMTKTSLHVAKDLFTKGKGLKLRQAISLLDNSFTQTRCHFLSSNSEVDWFKRATSKVDSRGSYCVYGSCSKKLGFVIPFLKVWPEMEQTVFEKCSEVLPLTPNLTLKEVYKQICHHFDSQNMDQCTGESEKEGESKLLELFSSLDISKQKMFLTKATKLHSEKVKESKMITVTRPEINQQDTESSGPFRNEKHVTVLTVQPSQAHEMEHTDEADGLECLSPAHKESFLDQEKENYPDELSKNDGVPTISDGESCEFFASEANTEVAVEQPDIDYGINEGSLQTWKKNQSTSPGDQERDNDLSNSSDTSSICESEQVSVKEVCKLAVSTCSNVEEKMIDSRCSLASQAQFYESNLSSHDEDRENADVNSPENGMKRRSKAQLVPIDEAPHSTMQNSHEQEHEHVSVKRNMKKRKICETDVNSNSSRVLRSNKRQK